MLTDQWFVAMSQAGQGWQEHHRTGARMRLLGRDPLSSGELGQHLQPVAQQHPGLVHFAPAVVGPPDSAWYGDDGRCWVAHDEAEEAAKRLAAADGYEAH